MELYSANRQWQSRPADERFTSLHALAAFTNFQRQHSARRVIPNRGLTVLPSATDPLDIAVAGPNGHPAKLTNWSYHQLASLAGVPGGYLVRSQMPGALAADNLNWGLHHHRQPESVSTLLRRLDDGSVWAAAFNGPDYGPIWDADIANTLVSEFGDGVTGDWRIPGEFGKKLSNVNKGNTTLYASDRDMYVFLADENNRIELPNRRSNSVGSSSGSLARGFYISNSEVGASYLRAGFFLFDYVCCNRIIWGAEQLHEIKIRHTAAAPHRWLEEVKPILRTLHDSSPAPIVETIRAAQQSKVRGDIAEFLSSRFGTGASAIAAAHFAEESRPIETVWDAVVGATAWAKSLTHQDARVKVERIAGDLLNGARSAKQIATTVTL